MTRIVYSRQYNIQFCGLERLHPFDSRKYGRCWKVLKKQFGGRLRELHVKCPGEATREELLLVHTEEYLGKLKVPNYVAGAIEVPIVRKLPAWLIDRNILRPMRWATKGTIIAAEQSLQCGVAINLGGGFHHAKPDAGEGFSIYADAAIAVASARARGLIGHDDRVIFVDTDAHQGNCVCHAFMNDRRAFIFDVFNSCIYPMYDRRARERIDCEVPLMGNCTNSEYLGELKKRLPGFLDSVSKSPVGLAFYNAGTDVFESDPLGGLFISAETILERDLFVIRELQKRKIPTVMVTSGGYTKQSFQLIANSVIGIINQDERF